ncbi:hypothetical protein H2202_011275, partial [Exophiala xenobiotica]
ASEATDPNQGFLTFLWVTSLEPHLYESPLVVRNPLPLMDTWPPALPQGSASRTGRSVGLVTTKSSANIMESIKTMITSPLQLVEEPKTEAQRDQPCIEQTPSPDAPNLQLRERDESMNNRLSQMELKNKWLKATLQQRTAEQFQRMRSFEEMERQNKVMVNGLQQFQEALHGLQEQVRTLQSKVEAILGRLDVAT